MLDLPPAAESVFRVVLIAVATLVAIVLLRKGVELGVRSVLERRRSQADADVPSDDVEKRVRTIARLASRVGAAILVTIAVLMALTEFGVEIGPAVAGLGVVGLAVGFGAQWLIRDWLAGIFVVLEGQYSVGDIVSIAGVNGVVEEFSLRRTVLRGLDGTIHIVPNGQITVASNLTRLWSRATVDIEVPAAADAGRASELADRAGAALKDDVEWGQRVLEAPAVVRIATGSEGSTVLTVLAVVRTAERASVSGELRERIENELAAEAIDVVGSEESSGSQEPAAAPAGSAR
jgi:small-conductance mechanosensitive channel